MWPQLRGSRFHGAKFRRQISLDRYVVDFYCRSNQVFESIGIRVVRFTNAEVTDELDSVLERIHSELKLPLS